MHLDTVLTMVDVDACTIYPGVVAAPTYRLTPGRTASPPNGSRRCWARSPSALGIAELRTFETGGDRFESAREQWDDGNNVLAIAPGVVVAYERNVDTNTRLRRGRHRGHHHRRRRARARPRRPALHVLPHRPRRPPGGGMSTAVPPATTSQEEHTMFTKIIVGVDGARAVAMHWRWPAALSASFRQRPRRPPRLPLRPLHQPRRRAATSRQAIHTAQRGGPGASSSSPGVPAHAIAVADGSPGRALQRAAAEPRRRPHRGRLGAPRSIGRVLAGDVTAGTLHGAPCPVVVAPRGTPEHGDALRRSASATTARPNRGPRSSSRARSPRPSMGGCASSTSSGSPIPTALRRPTRPTGPRTGASAARWPRRALPPSRRRSATSPPATVVRRAGRRARVRGRLARPARHRLAQLRPDAPADARQHLEQARPRAPARCSC